MRRINDTLLDLIIGILLYGICIVLVGSIFVHKAIPYLSGLMLGLLIAFVLSYHLFTTINRYLDMPKEEAIHYARSKIVKRYLIMGISIVVSLTFPKIFNCIAVIVGILSLKCSAYLQPITSKYIRSFLLQKGR